MQLIIWKNYKSNLFDLDTLKTHSNDGFPYTTLQPMKQSYEFSL